MRPPATVRYRHLPSVEQFRDGIAACVAGCLNLANYGYNVGRELGRLRPVGLGLNGPDRS
jgi:hypothetical protein